MTPKGEVVDGGGASTAVRILLPVAFMILFLLSVLMTSGFLLQGTATEKENKVVDVLLASANPDEVLSGKLLGLGAAGLLQVSLWLSLLMVGAVVVLRASLDAAALAWWEAAGAFVVLAGSTWLAIRIGARLFRIGLLSSGARPSFKEIIRQARL